MRSLRSWLHFLRSWNHRHTVLVLCVLAYSGIRFSEYVISLMYSDIRTGLGVSDFVIGIGFTASTISYALVQLPSGVLGDRFGERRVILTSLGLTALGSLTLALSTSEVLLVVAMTVLGGVSGAYYSPATALLTDLFEGTGRVIGIHRIGAQIVGFTGPLVALVGIAYGWRTVLALGAVVALPVCGAFALAVRPSPPTHPNDSLSERVQPAALSTLLLRPSIAFTTAIAGCAQFVETAMFSFLPGLLRDYHGISPGVVGLLFTEYFAVLAVTQPVFGALSDRFGRDPTTIGALALGISGFFLLLGGNSLAAIATTVGLIGCGMGWGPPVQSRFMDHLTDTERGRGFGRVRTVYIGAASACGIVIGSAVSWVGWPVAIGVLATVSALPIAAIGMNRLFRIEI